MWKPVTTVYVTGSSSSSMWTPVAIVCMTSNNSPLPMVTVCVTIGNATTHLNVQRESIQTKTNDDI